MTAATRATPSGMAEPQRPEPPSMEQQIARVCAALQIDRAHLNQHIVRDSMRIPYDQAHPHAWAENYALRCEVADLKARLRKVEHRVCVLRRRNRVSRPYG